MSKFNIKSSNKTTNIAGGNAYKFDTETELIHAVLTTFLDDKYYESGKDRLERVQDLVSKNKPEFVAKLAVFARTQFNLRSIVTVLLGELSKTHRGDDLVKRAIVLSANRVDDLTELVAYLKGKLPKQVKRGVRNALLKFNRYQLAKYKGESKGVSLVDVFNLTHPKVRHANEEQAQAWKDLIEGKLVSFDTWEVELSGAKNDIERKDKLSELILTNKIGYMALLRNLNNVVKYGCSDEVISHVVARISDREEVKKSKQFPFRFSTAYQNVQGNRKLTDAISQAMDYAVDNVPELSGKTLVALDVSGSMSGDPIKKGAIFAAALLKSNTNADFAIYADRLATGTVSSRTPIVDITKEIERLATGGGTNTGSVFEYALAKGGYNRIIIISDNESWNGSAQREYAMYGNSFPETYVYAIDITGYGTHDVTGNKVRHLAGWSDKILEFITESEGNLLERVKQVVL